MKRYWFIFAALLFLPAFLLAQKNGRKREKRYGGGDVYLRIDPPVSKLDRAIGCVYDNYNNFWTYGENNITGIDNFKKMEFGIGDLDGMRYLYLKKTYISARYYYNEDNPKESKHEETEYWNIYILDLEQYQKNVLDITDSYNVLYLDLLDIGYLKKKNDIDVSVYKLSTTPFSLHFLKLRINDHENALRRAKEKQDIKEIERLERAIKEIKIPYRDKNKLIIKFLIDENKEKVKFFIFNANTYVDDISDGRYIPAVNFFRSKSAYFEINLDKNTRDLMWSEYIFDQFYFEADYKKFMNFIQKPLEY